MDISIRGLLEALRLGQRLDRFARTLCPQERDTEVPMRARVLWIDCRRFSVERNRLLVFTGKRFFRRLPAQRIELELTLACGLGLSLLTCEQIEFSSRVLA